MRRSFNPQLSLGATPIEHITFNPKSRDDIPQILRGLQYLWTTQNVRDEILHLLESKITPEINFNIGRPGMDLWILLVLGCLRVGLNCDYDRLHELVNEHKTVRAMLGHGGWEDDTEYKLQTLKDNISLLTPELLEEINVIVVKSGHTLLKKKQDEIKGRCDSFVVKMNVEYPTDIGLLWDAMRTIILQVTRLCRHHRVTGWRQHSFALRRLKILFRKAQKSKRSRKVDADKMVKKAHRAYLKKAQEYLDKTCESVKKLEKRSARLEPDVFSILQQKLFKIAEYAEHATRQINQIERRVLNKESISSQEKVYSIFEPEVEWISKGKAGVPVELGIKVCIVEDQYQFILHHRVMQKEQDVGVAVAVTQAVKNSYADYTTCSFDKGFHSPENQTALPKIIDNVILPKKGKLTQSEKDREYSSEFKTIRRQHSAVESAINALQQHGLDRCPDRGIQHFKSYVALAVLSRNIQRIGTVLTNKEREALKREKLKKVA